MNAFLGRAEVARLLIGLSLSVGLHSIAFFGLGIFLRAGPPRAFIVQQTPSTPHAPRAALLSATLGWQSDRPGDAHAQSVTTQSAETNSASQFFDGETSPTNDKSFLGKRYLSAGEASVPPHVLSEVVLGVGYPYLGTGTILLIVLLDENGHVDDVQIEGESTASRLEREALEKFRTAHYAGAKLNGDGVKSWQRIEINLQSADETLADKPTN